MQARIDPKRPLREVPKRQRRAIAKPLADYAARWSDRDRAMAEAYRTGAYGAGYRRTLRGVSRMTVSRAVKRHEDAAAEHELRVRPRVSLTPRFLCAFPLWIDLILRSQ